MAALALGAPVETHAAPQTRPAPTQAPAQQGRPGVADRPAGPEAKGDARIRGRVVAADTGRPLRRALVRATSETTSRSASTDENGSFASSVTFPEPVAGRQR
jgi:hypothetical protein